MIIAFDSRLPKFGLLICLLAIVTGCSRKTTITSEAIPQVQLALNWFPEAEHGGFYAAQVHGFFAEEGVDVEIVPGGPGAPVIQQVAAGQVEFAIANADQVLLGREQGAPVVAVMSSLQMSPRCIMVHEKSGIKDLLELRDMTLAVGVGKPFAKYLLKRLGDANLNIVPYHGSVAMFLEKEDFAQQGYVFSEPFVAERQGGDPHCLMVSDIGFNPYAGLLITSDRLRESNPELVAKVVRACQRGWQKYLQDPAETNRHIHSQNEEMSLDTLAFGAEAIQPLCLPTGDAADFGAMSAERWQTLAEQLAEIELLKQTDVWRESFDVGFLPQ